MRVRITDNLGHPCCPLAECSSTEGEVIPYTFKNGSVDPIIMIAPPNRWAHESSIKRFGFKLIPIP